MRRLAILDPASVEVSSGHKNAADYPPDNRQPGESIEPADAAHDPLHQRVLHHFSSPPLLVHRGHMSPKCI